MRRTGRTDGCSFINSDGRKFSPVGQLLLRVRCLEGEKRNYDEGKITWTLDRNGVRKLGMIFPLSILPPTPRPLSPSLSPFFLHPPRPLLPLSPLFFLPLSFPSPFLSTAYARAIFSLRGVFGLFALRLRRLHFFQHDFQRSLALRPRHKTVEPTAGYG